MAQIIPFDSKSNVPAFLRNAPVQSDLASYVGQSFMQMSIKGKLFTVVKDGESKLLMNPKDPDSPASSIEVVMVRAQAKPSKSFYLKAYVEGEEAKAPDCFSNDGVKPDAASTAPQSKTCALCPHNQWGSRVNESGVAGKGKACNDIVRVAIAPPDNIEQVMQLRVPPASIRNLGELDKEVRKRGAAPHMVVTKISFDPTAPSPKLVFKPVGYVSEQTFAEVMEMRESDVVQSILGLDAVVPVADNAPLETVRTSAEVERGIKGKPEVTEPPVPEAKASKEVEEDEVEAAIRAAEKEAADRIAALRAKKKQEAAPAASDDTDPDFSNLKFDD